MSDKKIPRIYNLGGVLTVTRLKEIISEWPEKDEDDKPAEVWIGTGPGLSSPATEIWPLGDSDILFESNAFKPK